MSADYFLDSNILLYCFDPADPRKCRRSPKVHHLMITCLRFKVHHLRM